MDHAPRFLRSEGENRRHRLEQRIANQDERCLRGAPGAACPRRGVEPVLEDVEIETAEILGAVGLEPLNDEMELVARIVRLDSIRQRSRVRQREAIQLEKLLNRKRVL